MLFSFIFSIRVADFCQFVNSSNRFMSNCGKMTKFVVLLSFLAVVIQTTNSLTVYEQWLRDMEVAAASTQRPIQSRQTFAFPTKKQNPKVQPVVVHLPVVKKPVGKKTQESKLKRNECKVTHMNLRPFLQSAQNMRSLAWRHTESPDFPWIPTKTNKTVHSTLTYPSVTSRLVSLLAVKQRKKKSFRTWLLLATGTRAEKSISNAAEA